MTHPTEIAAIYFPSWHNEPRRNDRHHDGFTEWELIQAGRPRFDGHYQPQVPTLGYLDETIPENMQRSCDLATQAGIDAFLWDWYWYDGADFLNRPLNETFLTLHDPGIKFALMWANHDWVHVFPARVGQKPELVFKGGIDLDEFTRMTDVIIDRYLTHPQYWRINGAAWFTIFRVNEVINGVGGFLTAKDALEDFRRRAREAGAGELHLNAMGGYDEYTPSQLVQLGLDTVGTYGWNAQWEKTPPTTLTYEYEQWRANGQQEWEDLRGKHTLEVIPTVAMGWDSTTRVHPDDKLELSEWPYLPVVTNNTPEAFSEAISEAIEFTEHNPDTHVVVVNAWNEWTEGSYLEPDSRTGDAHLQTLARAVGRARSDVTDRTVIPAAD